MGAQNLLLNRPLGVIPFLVFSLRRKGSPLCFRKACRYNYVLRALEDPTAVIFKKKPRGSVEDLACILTFAVALSFLLDNKLRKKS